MVLSTGGALLAEQWHIDHRRKEEFAQRAAELHSQLWTRNSNSSAMHELTIAQSIVETVRGVAAEHGGGRVRKVHMRIGELSQVVPSTLREGFDVLAAGTPADGAALEIDWVPTVWWCIACDRRRPVDGSEDDCPCGASADRLEGSAELLLTAVDLDET